MVGKDNELAKDDIISEETEDTVDVDNAFYKNIFDAGRRETIQGGCGNIQFGRNDREVLLASEDDAFAASAYDNAYVFDKRDLNDDVNKNSSPGEEIHIKDIEVLEVKEEMDTASEPLANDKIDKFENDFGEAILHTDLTKILKRSCSCNLQQTSW